MESSFTIVTNEIFKDKELTMQEKYLLIVLKSFDHKRVGAVFPTYETIMEISGIYRRNTISDIIKSLSNKLYIEKRKKGRVNYYCFIKDYLLEGVVDGECNSDGENSINSDINKDNSFNNDTSCILSEPSSISDINAWERKSIGDDTDNVLSDCTSISGDIDKSRRTSIKVDTSNGIDTSLRDRTSINSDISTSINGGTLKIKDKNKKEIYIGIVKRWNSKGLSIEKNLSTRLSNSITKALNTYSLQEVLKAIDNYSEVYHSDFYYNHLWSLQDFLIKSNGIDKFVDEGDMWRSYLRYKPKVFKINVSDYID